MRASASCLFASGIKEMSSGKMGSAALSDILQAALAGAAKKGGKEHAELKYTIELLVQKLLTMQQKKVW